MSKNSDAVKVAIIGLIGTIAVALIAIIPDLIKGETRDETPRAPVTAPVAQPTGETPAEQVPLREVPPPAEVGTDEKPALLHTPEAVNRPPPARTGPAAAVPVAADTSAAGGNTFDLKVRNNNGLIMQGNNLRTESITFGNTGKQDTSRQR